MFMLFMWIILLVMCAIKSLWPYLLVGFVIMYAIKCSKNLDNSYPKYRKKYSSNKEKSKVSLDDQKFLK